jgi:hypothetical protein
MTKALQLPRRGRGRPTPEAAIAYQANLERFAAAILKISSRLDFKVSSRGWCYLLEDSGLTKGDFNYAQGLINDCRKSGVLPLDICCEDDGRQAANLERINRETPEQFAASWVDYVRDKAHEQFTPFSFWRDLLAQL